MSARLLSARAGRAGLPWLLLAATIPQCAPALRSTAPAPLTRSQEAELWIRPDDIGRRDLFFGPGGPDLAPRDGATFRYVALDRTGFSGGYDVADASGRRWSVKQGSEAQSEVAASRLLWAVGYHQPPTYYVTHWRLADGPRPGPQNAGRFRPEDTGAEVVSEWSWQRNPFVGTRAFRGLIVLNLLINNWDFKTTNNKVYRVAEPGSGPARRFVVRDLGAAFGKSRRFPWGTRNNVADFESQQFVRGVENGRVQFDYHGRHRELLADLTTADVIWACELVAQVSDAQLDAAFRAAGYDEEPRRRFVARLKAKIAQGLQLRRGV